jgi:hypothetical protein
MEKKNNSSSNCSCGEYLIQIQKLMDELDFFKNQCTRLKIIVDDNGLGEEVGKVSDAEVICTEQISKLLEISKESVFSQEDAKTLDILHRNLKLARGEKVKQDSNSSTKKLSDKDLLNLLKN